MTDDLNEKALLVAHQAAFTAGPLTLDLARAAITAYLSALPERELLAEALEALDGVIRVADRKTVEFDAARAAADKIRAALEHQQHDKGEKL
jgi:hypothetical protein